MIALAALLLALAPSAAGASDRAPALTPELLVNHPGYDDASYDAMREDWLAALEAAPESPLALAAVALIGTYEPFCASVLDPARLRALVPRVTDADASLELRRLVLRELRRRRFSEDWQPLEEELFPDLLTHWRVLGPWGRLDAVAPLWAPSDPGAPERALAATYPADGGGELRWRALERERNELTVAPDPWTVPDQGGTSYLLCFVDADAERATLQVFCREAFQAYWNGTRVLDVRRGPAFAGEGVFDVPVALGDGWNALLLRFENGAGARVSARLLDASGGALACEEARWDGVSLPASARTEPLPPSAAEPATPGAFGGVLDQALVALRGRADRALVHPEPEDPAAQRAWMRVRFFALQRSEHLPAEVRRRLMLELYERLRAGDGAPPEIRAAHAQRLAVEDKPTEAIAIADALVEEHPGVPAFRTLRLATWKALDSTGQAARPLAHAFAADFPHATDPLIELERWSEDAGDWPGAALWARRALEADGAERSVWKPSFGALARGSDADAELARAWLERWRADEPGSQEIDVLLRALAAERGDPDAVFASARAETERRPFHPAPWADLARVAVVQGRLDEARAAFGRAAELAPGDPNVRDALELAGVPNEAEEFFETFAPDAAAALAASVDAAGASTALVLDSGMAFVRPDGSTHRRTHSITRALDRKGTESIHEERAQANTRVARVIDQSGDVFEPTLVDGAWVWPALDPGDAVELVHDDYTHGRRGVPPELGSWRFSSFEEPFVLSRFVVWLPPETPGEWKQASFEGEHEEIPWHGGTVHVWTMRDQPRQVPEQFMPSEEELLPWIAYGEDTPAVDVKAGYEGYVDWLSAVAADLEGDLADVVATVDASAPELERARALHDAVGEHVLDFSDDGDPSDVWLLRRGRPIGVLAALYERAGIGFRWAVLHPPVSPELDPSPVRPFVSLTAFGLPVLRLDAQDEGGEHVWVVMDPAGRGLPFGLVPETLAGARALLLGGDAPEWTEVPRAGLSDVWSLDLDVTYRLSESAVADTSGTLRITGARGARLREGLFQAEPERRSQFARGVVANVVQGLDLTEWDFVGLADRGGSLELRFAGRIPDFVQGSDGDETCRLRIPPAQVSSAFGAAERRWPLAFRQDARLRAHVRLECGDRWRYEYAPTSFVDERQGFEFSMEVERDEGVLDVTRIVRMRGLRLEPAELGPFLRRVKECEDEEARPVRLTARKG